MGFKFDRKIKADEKDLELSKEILGFVLTILEKLQKDKKSF